MSLKFKGEKSKKKKRSHKDVEEADLGEGSSTGTVKQRYGKNPEGMLNPSAMSYTEEIRTDQIACSFLF